MANRLEGDYIKLGLDVAGYRDKRESDLTALAQRIGAKAVSYTHLDVYKRQEWKVSAFHHNI